MNAGGSTTVGSTQTVYVRLPLPPFASVAVTSNVTQPGPTGMPDSRPFEASVRPATGKPALVKVYGGVPPVAAIVCANPLQPGGSSGGSVSDGQMLYERIP